MRQFALLETVMQNRPGGLSRNASSPMLRRDAIKDFNFARDAAVFSETAQSADGRIISRAVSIRGKAITANQWRRKVRVRTHSELPAPMAFDQQSVLMFQNENRAPNCAWNGLPAPPMKPLMTLNRSLLDEFALKLLPGLSMSKRLNASKNNPSRSEEQ